MKIRLTKISECENPLFQSADHNFNGDGEGIVTQKSLAINYMLEGYLLGEIVLNQPIRMFRTMRNNVETPGLFVSSMVQEIDKDKIVTLNSIYKLEKISDLI